MSVLAPDSLRIRPYRPQDLAALHKMDHECFPDDIAFSRAEMRSCLTCRGSIVCVAEQAERIAGFAVGLVAGDGTAHVLTLDVAPALRRHRIGTSLMEHLHHEFLLRGAAVSVLEVDVGNAAARRFYEMLHYRYAVRLPGYYNKRIDAFRMMRDLT